MIEEYLKSIACDDKEIQGGMLSELEEEVPKELHGDLMETLRGSFPKPRNHNFRRYASIAAGLVLILLSWNFISSQANFRIGFSRNNSEMAIPQSNNKFSPNEEKGFVDDRVAEDESIRDGDVISDKSMSNYTKVVLQTTDIDLIDFIEKNGVIKEKGVYSLEREKYKFLFDMIKEKKDNARVYYPESDEDFSLNTKYEREFILVKLIKE